MSKNPHNPEWKEIYQLVVHNASDAIFCVKGTKIEFFNPKALQVTGFSENELLNKNFIELFVLKDRPEIKNSFSSLQLNENLKLEPVQIITKAGKKKWANFNLAVINWQGNVYRLIYLNDITKKKALQDELEIAQRLESAGRVASQIAHDFNNLLSPITAYPAIIREEISDKKNCVEMLEEIEFAARSLAQINQQLLALGRRGHYSMEKIDLKDLVNNLVSAIKIPKGIKVRKLFRTDLFLIKGGMAQLNRVFTNLIQNAIEAMDGNGVLNIYARNVEVERTINGFYSIRRGNYVKIDIKDNGCGILPEVHSRIFEPFFTTKKINKKRGSGLGLSIVRNIIEAHNAYLTFETSVGRGTTFSIYLPALKRAKKRIRKLAHKAVSGDENILIVDDDPVQRKVASQLLKRLGYHVHVLSTGEGAVRHFKKNSYDLVIMDMIMNGIDGVETYRKMLEIDPTQRAIIVSGFAMANKVKQAKKLGARSFVTKPITRNALAEAVRRELDRKGTHHSVN